MEAIFSLGVWALNIAILYFVIKTAVKAALREHNAEK